MTETSKLSREDLFSLEQYAEKRADFRQKVMQHKKHRQIALGPNSTLYFEDRLTIQYQIQEMLRIEKIFESAEIKEELDAYNPLIPDGSNLKATFMIEYADAEIRAAQLAILVGIEHVVYMQVEGFDPVWAIADEDLERATEEKTSSVHFMRFEFSDDMLAALSKGATFTCGVKHAAYSYEVELDGDSRQTLLGDFNLPN